MKHLSSALTAYAKSHIYFSTNCSLILTIGSNTAYIVCVCVCMYVYVCVLVNFDHCRYSLYCVLYVYICACIYAYICACRYCIYIYIYIYIYTYTCIYCAFTRSVHVTYAYIWACIYTCMLPRIASQFLDGHNLEFVYVQNVHTHTYAHVFIHVCYLCKECQEWQGLAWAPKHWHVSIYVCIHAPSSKALAFMYKVCSVYME